MQAFETNTKPVPREAIESAVRERLAKEPMVSSVDYVSLASRDTMQVGYANTCRAGARR